MKPCFFRILITLAIVAALAGDVRAEQGKPNILLIMADDVGSDAVGCYGGQSYPTPHIDALAAGGMKFTHAYAMPVCHPSRICLSTGRYPFRFGKAGMTWGSFPKQGESISIGHVMKRGGYATAVAGKWQLCLMKNSLLHPKQLGFDQWSLFGWHEGARYRDPMIYENGKIRATSPSDYGPELYVDFLLKFMRSNHADKRPFFAYYPMALCHDVTDDLKGKHVAFNNDGRWMTYPEMVASMDDMVGRLIKGLEEMGARQNTLVIFTTDNGTPNASYLSVDAAGKMTRPKVFSIRDGVIVPGGKGRTDDTGTRVPFIANWPGVVEAKSTTDVMVDLTDLLPTIAEAANIEDNTTRDGISFLPTLQGRLQPTPLACIFIVHRGKRCVRSKEWKLYEDGRFYNMTADPQEKRPLVDKDRPTTAQRAYLRLKAALDSLQTTP